MAHWSTRQSYMLGTANPGATTAAIAALGRGRVVRTSQPQTPVGIDWSNPITRGLTFAVLPSVGDLVNGFKAVRTNTALRLLPGPVGVGVNYNGDTAGTYGWQYGPNGDATGFDPVSGDLTALIVGQRLASHTGGKLLAGNYSGANSYKFSSSFLSPNYRFQFTVAGDASLVGATSVNVNDTLPHVIVGKLDASVSTVTVYVDGKSPNSAAGADTFTSNTSAPACILGDNALGLPAPAGVYLYLHWKRSLNPAEIASISANPWQIFLPSPQPIWVPA